MKKLFGTDGIRGLANQYPMTSEVALSVGRAMTHVLKKKHRPKILIGKDTRLSCYMLETALASGACSMGGDVLLLGPMPTPGIAFLTLAMRADAGVVISASHNPYQDNGIKIFCGHGFKLPDSLEAEIESLVLSRQLDDSRPTGSDVGRITRIDDASGRYIEFLKARFPKEQTLEGLRIVVDCAHGATYKIAPTVLEELGAQVIVIGNRPNGRNINDNCGATSPQNMARTVLETHSHIGLALDGDGDRLILADEKGQIIDGDAILAICSTHLQEKGRLPQDTVVSTIMSNQGLEEYLKTKHISLLRAAVGDRYVVNMMREKGCMFGGESSGHLIFLDQSTTGDGLLAALEVLSVMKEKQKPLSELVGVYEPYPQILKNVKVKERKDLSENKGIQKLMKEIETKLNNRGRLLVRYSGTEPLVRVMVEGRDIVEIEKMADDLTVCIKENLGA